MTDRRLPTVEDWLSACERAGFQMAQQPEGVILQSAERAAVGMEL